MFVKSSSVTSETMYQTKNMTSTASSLTLTNDNLNCITTINNLITLYGFRLRNTQVNSTFSNMKFLVDIGNTEKATTTCDITVTSGLGIYRLMFNSSVGTHCDYQSRDMKEIEKMIVDMFDKMLDYDLYAKIKFDFREKLGANTVAKFLETRDLDVVKLDVDGITLTCKALIPDFDKTKKNRLVEKEMMFSTNISLGGINISDTVLPQSNIITLVQNYSISWNLQFLIKFLKLFTRFDPRIEKYNQNTQNANFNIRVSSGKDKPDILISFDNFVTQYSNPLSYIYCMEYLGSSNHIVGSNLLKLVYLISGADMAEFNRLANVAVTEPKPEKIPKAIGLATKAKVPKVKVPKVKKEKKEKLVKIKKPKIPAFIHTAATYVPTKQQPYPLSFTTLERTIGTFNDNHKNVLRRFTNDMTFDEFCTFKNTFNRQVGFTPDQTHLIQMLPNDRDYMVAFLKVYDLI
jgi:hypothetical protein